MNYALVFLGGGLGSLTRFAFSKYFGTWQNGFPLSTFLSNALSCVILGCTIGWLFSKQPASNTNNSILLFVATGFCGGFSTFSTFSLDTFQLMNNGQYGIAIMNIAANMLVCLVAVALGFYIGKAL